jgi:hypothetical protein
MRSAIILYKATRSKDGTKYLPMRKAAKAFAKCRDTFYAFLPPGKSLQLLFGSRLVALHRCSGSPLVSVDDQILCTWKGLGGSGRELFQHTVLTFGLYEATINVCWTEIRTGLRPDASQKCYRASQLALKLSGAHPWESAFIASEESVVISWTSLQRFPYRETCSVLRFPTGWSWDTEK